MLKNFNSLLAETKFSSYRMANLRINHAELYLSSLIIAKGKLLTWLKFKKLHLCFKYLSERRNHHKKARDNSACRFFTTAILCHHDKTKSICSTISINNFFAELYVNKHQQETLESQSIQKKLHYEVIFLQFKRIKEWCRFPYFSFSFVSNYLMKSQFPIKKWENNFARKCSPTQRRKNTSWNRRRNLASVLSEFIKYAFPVWLLPCFSGQWKK